MKTDTPYSVQVEFDLATAMELVKRLKDMKGYVCGEVVEVIFMVQDEASASEVSQILSELALEAEEVG